VADTGVAIGLLYKAGREELLKQGENSRDSGLTDDRRERECLSWLKP
jgi:hypothetical protein